MPMPLNLPPNKFISPPRSGIDRLHNPPKPEAPEGKKMGYALWCDQHGGPFSPKDPDMQEYSKKKRIGDTSYDDETFTLCGPCAGGFQVGKPTATALEAKIAAAEHDLGMD